MAIDYEAIVRDYYKGNAELLAYPITPNYTEVYTPLEELPESSRELYSYNPEKARQLLADAGYPDGFDTEAICISSSVDQLSIVEDYWKDINVNLKIVVKDSGVHTTYINTVPKIHEHMLARESSIGGRVYNFNVCQVGSALNNSMIDDPYINELVKVYDDNIGNDELQYDAMKKLNVYGLEQVVGLQLPGPYVYTFWSPWVKGYSGEGNDFEQYIWIDQDLKTQMGR